MEARRWWCMPLIPALRRKRQEEFCEFEASLDTQSFKKLSRKKKQEKMKWKKIEEDIQLLPLTFPHHTHKHLLDRQIGLLVTCLPCKSDNLKRCVCAHGVGTEAQSCLLISTCMYSYRHIKHIHTIINFLRHDFFTYL